MYIRDLLERFAKQEEGIALTEYLMLLGLLSGGIISVVLVFSSTAAGKWESWSSWFSSGVINALSS
jgi:pilus assembly protein Flp/PilA